MMKNIIVASVLVFIPVAHSATKSLDSIWGEFHQKSLQQKSLDLEKEANDLSLARAKRHWLPRAYVTGQWFNTNDPGQVFFNNLGQRSIGQSDFVPNSLNHPDRKNFKMGALGVDLPLYEGGMKSSQTSMFAALAQASLMEIKAKKSEEYSDLGRQYGTLIIAGHLEKNLRELKRNLESILSTYQVGSQSNPVGHSGLLGLQSVNLRIEGILSEFDLKILSAKKWISDKADIQEEWSADLSQDLKTYLDVNLSEETSKSYSSTLMAQELKVKTLLDAKDMEKARFLPRIGLFAQNQLYSGDRDTNTSQTFGLYLMWDLFNGDSWGRVGEANARALAANAKLEAYKQEEKIMLQQMKASKLTLEKSLLLLERSDALLKEQSLTAMKLFRSGMLGALQLAEVINRRVDLIDNKSKAQVQYLEIQSRMYQLLN